VGKWLDKAIKKGNPNALLEKFECLLCEGDKDEALLYLDRAKIAGIPNAWTRKACMVWNGEVDQTDEFEPNYNVAVELFIGGAERGCIHAQFQLGDLFIEGSHCCDIHSNHDEAVKWLNRVIQNTDLSQEAIHTKIESEILLENLADKHKNAQAQWVMGVIFRDGLTVQRRSIDQTVMAMSYFKMAAEQGHEKAKHDLHDLHEMRYAD
jgi:TPR repeat protein